MSKPDPVLVVGAGLGGLVAALSLAPRPVILLASAKIGEGAASAWAQGGIAAAVGPGDSAKLHAGDTIAAGDGLCDPEAVARIIGGGPGAIAALRAWGVEFDLDAAGNLALGLEAAHSHRRIVHAGGDASGREVVRALGAQVAACSHIELRPNHTARRILTRDGEVSGLVVDTPHGQFVVPGRQVVIATGGVGGLFLSTTNPLTATGSGLALAARAGAVMADMEFVQFHPTALAVGIDPMPLVSEAVRGEAAILVDETGERFMTEVPQQELAPRDVVSRNVWRQLMAGHQVYLDARACLGPRFAVRFPAITALCQAGGIDPASQPIPIRPAAHYHMGGIATDQHGRTSLPGLWACGEAACTGLHGANRLASNSLLEALVFSHRCYLDSVQQIPYLNFQENVPDWNAEGTTEPDEMILITQSLKELQLLMSDYVGIVRTYTRLQRASKRLDLLHEEIESLYETTAVSPQLCEVRNLITVGYLIVKEAQFRKESRGLHYNTDYPQKSPLIQNIVL